MLSFILASGLSGIVCPNWLPGTNEVLPRGVELSKPLKLKNKLRCYCEVVIPAEETCMRVKSREVCKSRTQQWIRENFPDMLNPISQNTSTPRMRMMSIEP